MISWFCFYLVLLAISFFMLAGFDMQDRTFAIESVSKTRLPKTHFKQQIHFLSLIILIYLNDLIGNGTEFPFPDIYSLQVPNRIVNWTIRDWNQSQIVQFFTILIPILHPMLVHLNVIFSYLCFMNMNNHIAKWWKIRCCVLHTKMSIWSMSFTTKRILFCLEWTKIHHSK